MISVLKTVNKRLPWRTLWVVVLLVVTVSSAAIALSAIAHGLDTLLALLVATIAMGVGWALAFGRVSGPMALTFAWLGGAVFLTIRIGRIGKQLLAALGVLFELLVESIQAWGVVTAEPINSTFSELVVHLSVFYGRIWLWLQAFVTDQWIVDPVASAFVWSTLIWGAAVPLLNTGRQENIEQEAKERGKTTPKEKKKHPGGSWCEKGYK